MIAQVAEALDTAHAAGLVHRDVKAVERDGAGPPPRGFRAPDRFRDRPARGHHRHPHRPRVGRHLDLHGARTVRGRPRRQPQRRLRPRGGAVLRGDRQKPFVAPPNTEPDLLYYLNSHLHRPPPRPSDHASAVARAELARWNGWCTGMAKRPTERYASAGELAAAATPHWTRARATARTALRRSARRTDWDTPTARPARTPPPAPRVRVGQPRPPRAFVPTGRRVTPTSTPHDHTARVGGLTRRAADAVGIGALVVTLALVGAALMWANLPKTGTVPLQSDHPSRGPDYRTHPHRPHRQGVRGGDRAAGRAPGGGLRQRRRHGAGVGPGHRRHRSATPFTGHTGPVSAVATAQLRRAPGGGHRQRGHDGAGVGPGHRDPGRRPRSPATPARWTRWRPRSSTGARSWSPAAATARCGCGTWPPATPVGDPFTGHTGAVAAVATAQLDGRPVVVTGSDDDDGAGVGPGHRRPGRRPVHRPHRLGAGGGDRAARRAPGGGHRRRRRHGAGVGPGHRAPGRRPVHRPHRAAWSRWRPRSCDGRRSWSPAAGTTRCGCGTWPPGRRSAHRSPATPTWCARWRPRSSDGRPVVVSGGEDRRCGCGTWPRGTRQVTIPNTASGVDA